MLNRINIHVQYFFLYQFEGLKNNTPLRQLSDKELFRRAPVQDEYNFENKNSECAEILVHTK